MMWVPTIATFLLISTLLMFQIQRMISAVKILSLQSLFLSVSVAILWYTTRESHFFILAILTLLIKTILIPYILYFTIFKIDTKREVERLLGKYTSLFIAFMLSLFAYYLTLHLNLPNTEMGKPYLPVSLAMIFLGSFIMIDHKKALMQGIGLITIENGLFLITLSFGFRMPLFIELGIFFDLLITAIIIGIFSYRIHSTFESLNTEKLTNLKG